MASGQKTTVLPLVLFCVLLTLLVLKVASVFRTVPLQPFQRASQVLAPTEDRDKNIDPNSIRLIAQVAPPPSNPLAAATPAYSSCSTTAPPAGEKEARTTASVAESCAQQTVNLSQYVTPTCGSAGSNCGSVTSSSLTLTDSYIGGVTNSVENLGNGIIKQKSNDIYFLYRNNGSYIGILQDTIWGGSSSTPDGNFYCDGTKDQAFYRVYDQDGSWGNKQYPVTAQCGQNNTNTGSLKAYKKKWNGMDINAGVDPLIPDNQLQECSVTGQSNIKVTSTNKMIFQGKAKCNGQDFNMVAMLITGGAGTDEVNMYCEGKGLCAFYQKLDFSRTENQPKNWTGKDICNLKASGSKSDVPNYFEYNLGRQCGQTPVKVLNNFLDEYSVSCMPQAYYVMGYLRREQCGRTGKGCADWNSPGELKFTAGGTLFGLFRNEAAINKRLYTYNGLKDKSRQESIEAYFTAKPDHVPAEVQRSGVEFSGDNVPDIGLLSPYQSPLYKLSTLDQQCRLVYDKLAAVKELCAPFNRIEGEEGSECAINQFLPNHSQYRYLDMLEKIGNPDNCFQLMHPDSTNTAGVTLRDQILMIDPAMEVAYRPAFIVMVTLVGDQTQVNPRFWPQSINKETQLLFDYMEVKVPSFGSDFVRSSGNAGGGAYRDPLRFTADILLTSEQQQKMSQEEENDRNQVRATATQYQVEPFNENFIKPGPIIGVGPDGKNVEVRCRVPGNQDPPVYTNEQCKKDNIAQALIAFINSSAGLPAGGEGPGGASLLRQNSPPRSWLEGGQCKVFEKDLYGNAVLTQFPVDPKYQVAEQAQSIGSKLETKPQVGAYTKKREAFAETTAVVTDMANSPKNEQFGQTQVFFISPHNYTLLYAQNAFLSFLTPDQKEALMKNENFNSVLKTTGVDSFTSSTEKSTYQVVKGTGENGPPCPANDLNNSAKCDTVDVTAQIKRRTDSSGKELDSPVMWQVAGNVANLPTRLFTLLTTDIDSKMYRYTLGCTGPNATENWLLGKCQSVDRNQSTQPAVPPASPSASNTCINAWVSSAEQQSAAAQIKRDLPLQQLAHGDPTYNFAGWAAYFNVTSHPDDQHLFRNDCLGQSCINYVVDRVTQETEMNPYLAIAIALNETGGLTSSEPNFVGPHFGCGLDPNRSGFISNDTIENKLECMMRFFAANRGLSSDEALKKYGYHDGMRNESLNKIIGFVSKGEYKGSCQ